ncbi:MAG TPA: TorF family putative porin [Asticcacaulis sp.]
MKKTLLVAAVALSALFAGSAAMAQDNAAGSLTFNIAATSNYVWRGVTQTNNGAAVQGGADYSKGIFYAGTWLSNVDWGTSTNTEADFYMGVTPKVGNYGFDFGVIYYTYPGHDDADKGSVGELKAAVNHTMGKGTIGAAMYLPTESLEDPYYEVNASYPLTDKLTLSGAVGNYESGAYSYTDGAGQLINATGYTTENIGVTYALTQKLGLDLRWTNASRLPSTFAATLKATF